MPYILPLIAGCKPTLPPEDIQPIADLFTGIGAVSKSLADLAPVIANDTSHFINCVSRAELTTRSFTPSAHLLISLRSLYAEAYELARRSVSTELADERKALQSGSWRQLADYMNRVPHQGSDKSTRSLAESAAKAEGIEHFQLAKFYFAGGYLSLDQALKIDAIRYAIELLHKDDKRYNCIDDILKATWLTAISSALNSPGHAANYLRAHDAHSAARVRRSWSVDPWDRFVDALAVFRPSGTKEWRAQNVVTNDEARGLLASDRPFGIVYADPPYTKDHYSRFYHLYETMYLYDYPDTTGHGRYRTDRFTSDFSTKSRVVGAFAEMFDLVRKKSATLVLSYPGNGLLYSTGYSVETIAREFFRTVEIRSVAARHSTMGGRTGRSTKLANEKLFVCEP
ncbi:DNA adenine methylase [Mycolicibacterium arseniciresistens]|uniref:site-specific DNA-methyltransferase (adenine-specific) n=1 Tax=Mycolicibacterium arseniciresistens TaxID=3062257 RepID=A0ABT8UPM9_9MYCO|nr:DNA adenine methylase [Mycolicibacterium arseniciresistens]MDO3639755.1 DNA adenine methylase [Mycolicibacterium arseniciresistens]